MKNLFYTILSFLLLLTLTSCDEEVKRKAQTETEKYYLEDYISPDYLWGYIDENGNEVIPAIYDDTRDFEEGLAAVNYKGYWGFIDKRGDFAIDPVYREVYNFSEGFAVAHSFRDTFFLVDKIGQIIKDLPYKEVFSISSGFVRVKKNQGYLFVDKGGNPINEEIYDKAFDFKGGIAIVGIKDKLGIINTAGIEILPIIYTSLALVNEAFIKVKLDDNFYKLFEIATRKFVPGKFRSILSSGDTGLAVLNKENKWLIYPNKSIDHTFISYNNLYSGGEGKWFFRLKNKFGILDSLGNLLTDEKFDALYRFTEKRCVYNIGDFWGYLGERGEKLTPPLFPLAWDFKNGKARIIVNGGIGFINIDGSLAIPARFIEVRDFYQGFARFQKIR